MARILAFLVAALAAVGTALATPTPAVAATLNATCGDTGQSTQLRQLIAAANANDTIVMPACTTTLTGGPLVLGKSLVIHGAGSQLTIIDGGGASRVFDITGGSTAVVLQGLTISNGHADSGAGIRNGGSLALSNSSVNFNTATNLGGGIYNTSGGTVLLAGTMVSGNTGPAGGGGIYNDVGVLSALNTTISGNHATFGSGGGIASNGTAILSNVTLSGNSASGSGGGISTAFSGAATLSNNTITGNTANTSGGGLWSLGSSNITVRNTIVANNTAPAAVNCGRSGFATITSHGHNLSSDGSCALDFHAAGDLNNTEPELGPLQLNGGSVATHALLAGSPAIDAGDNATCANIDARGVPRPLDVTMPGLPVCDMGAYELETLGFLEFGMILSPTTVHPGDLLSLSLVVGNIGGGARTVDVYLAVLLPPAAGPALGCLAGEALAFIANAFTTVTIHCLSASPASFPPLFQSVPIAADFLTTTFSNVFAAVWPAGVPAGPARFVIALTPVGAFTDGRVSPLEGMVANFGPFTVAP